MSWDLWLHGYPTARRSERVDTQDFRSSVPCMMGLFKISIISIFFQISMNPMVRVEVPQSFQTWTPTPAPNHCLSRTSLATAYQERKDA